MANICEPFLPFLRREPDPARQQHLCAEEHVLSERTALWGGPDKICLLPRPLYTADLLASRFGYRISAVILDAPEHRLSQAVADSAETIAWLSASPLVLGGYAATKDFVNLVATLRAGGVDLTADHTTVSPEVLRILAWLETKSGFREVASGLLDGLHARLPAGTTCESPGEALDSARRMSRITGAAVIKADDGEGGYGNLVLPACELERIDEAALLEACPFLGVRSVVEEYVSYTAAPSVEYVVPPPPRPPVATYVCTQLFDDNNYFTGVRLSPEDLCSSWYEPLIEFGQRLAGYLQQHGYRGHFDVDALVTADGRLNLVEANLRRTGGTHVHDFARTVVGDDYSNRVEILSQSIAVPHCSPAEVLRRLDPLVVDPGSSTGVLPVIVGTAPAGSVELMVFAQDKHRLSDTRAAAVQALIRGGGAT